MILAHEHEATLIERSLLTKNGSTKEVWHLVLQIDSPHFAYEVGDSLAVFAENEKEEVEALLSAFQIVPGLRYYNEKLQKEEDVLFLLRKRFDLSKISLKLVQAIAGTLTGSLRTKIDAFIQQYASRGIIPCSVSLLLRTFGHGSLSFNQFLSLLLPLVPRYYSIASSPKKNPRSVDLTVACVSHDVLGTVRYGLCSHFLTRRASVHTHSMRVFVQSASHFRLPFEKESPLIMIGPGTGIAPFRAFLQELEQTRISLPPCWLFFGARHQKSDFLYEEFFVERQRRGSLLLDVAFSRDYEEKVYVQHKMWQQRNALVDWIDRKGAHVYLCGDAKRMAKDVERTFLDMLVDQSVVSTSEDAKRYLRNMHRQGRYSKDIY